MNLAKPGIIFIVSLITPLLVLSVVLSGHPQVVSFASTGCSQDGYREAPQPAVSNFLGYAHVTAWAKYRCGQKLVNGSVKTVSNGDVVLTADALGFGAKCSCAAEMRYTIIGLFGHLNIAPRVEVTEYRDVRLPETTS